MNAEDITIIKHFKLLCFLCALCVFSEKQYNTKLSVLQSRWQFCVSLLAFPIVFNQPLVCINTLYTVLWSCIGRGEAERGAFQALRMRKIFTFFLQYQRALMTQLVLQNQTYAAILHSLLYLNYYNLHHLSCNIKREKCQIKLVFLWILRYIISSVHHMTGCYVHIPAKVTTFVILRYSMMEYYYYVLLNDRILLLLLLTIYKEASSIWISKLKLVVKFPSKIYWK